MNNYLLFIDTEASGLPKNWKLPYEAVNNWPYCVQISWIIFRKDGRQVKEENHYITNSGFTIDESAIKIHGITTSFLQQNGENRKDILQLLTNDVREFNPLVIGHFIQFDFSVLGAEFYREKMDDTLQTVTSFCTMLGSRHLVKNPSVKFLRLEQLYYALFNKTFANPHNANADAKATASCFFEMIKRGEINEEIIEKQQQEILKKDTLPPHGCFIPLMIVIFLTFLIFYV